MQTELSIIIPVWNEGENIKHMLKALYEVSPDFQVIIVYDFLEDNTVPVAREFSKDHKTALVHNTKGKGVANAIRSGIEAATGTFILILAADDVGPVSAIPDMLALMDEGCEFISCTRYAYGGKRDKDSLIQRVLSRSANKLFTLITGSAFSDMTTGFKMFKKEILPKLNLESHSTSWAIVFEMAIKAQAAQLQLGEVPIRSTDRTHGKSTFKPGPWVKEYLHWFWWGIWKLHRTNIKKPLVRITTQEGKSR